MAHTKLRSGALPAAERCPELQLRVLLVQALSKHIEQLEALPDDLREDVNSSEESTSALTRLLRSTYRAPPLARQL